MRDDLRQAVRFLWRRRGATMLAAATLAVGIGATTLIFSVANAALFKPLPYRDAERLVDFAHVYRRGTAEQTFEIGMSEREALLWRAQASLFDGLEMFGQGETRKLAAGLPTGEIRVGRLSAAMLPLLGIPPRIGRGFLREEAIKGNDRVLLLSDGLWTRRFGGDAGVVGKSITLDGIPHTVIGVLPRVFRFRPFERVDAWTPLVERAGSKDIVGTVARLRPGLSFEQAAREAREAGRYVGKQLSYGEDLDVQLVRVDALRPAEQSRTALAMILGASGFLLLIACANVGNLLLALSVARQREVAVKRALGASRGRIVRQAMIEGFLLSGLGALGGLLLTMWGGVAAPAVIPARLGLFAIHDLENDGRVIAFAVILALVTGLLATLVSIGRQVESDTAELQGRSVSSTPRSRLRSLLLGAQVALTLVLLVGAGLFAVSLADLVRAEPGFDPEGLGYLEVSLPERSYPTEARRDAFFDELVARMATIPGVQAAARGMSPISGLHGILTVEGRELRPRSAESLEITYVGRDYFKVTGIRVREGRVPDSTDSAGSPPVAVISAGVARKYWPEGAIGKRFRYSPYVPWITVIGIADDVKTTSATWTAGTAEVYLPWSQTTQRWGDVLFRTAPGYEGAFDTIRAIVTSMDPDLPAPKYGLVTDAYGDLYASPRFFASLMSLFAVVALVTAAIGLGASLMYTVGRRTREIGVRMALGAGAWSVRRLVLRDALGAVIVGALVGLIAVFWLGRLVESMLFGISSRNPVAIVSAAAVLILTAGVASYLPARRATQVDPMIALRTE